VPCKEQEVEQAAELAKLIASIQTAARHTLLEEVAKGDHPPSFEEFRDHYAGMLLSEAFVMLTMKSWNEPGSPTDRAPLRAALSRLAVRLSKLATRLDNSSDYVVTVLRRDRVQ
jgi:hypothetical protein